jgi:hypothetical protein
MDTDKEKIPRKQRRTDFIVSLTTGIILFGMGLFAMIVCGNYPSFAEEIGLPVKLKQITGFPLFDVFGYLFQFMFGYLIIGIYGIFPFVCGFGIIIRNVMVMLTKNDDEPAHHRRSADMNIVDLCFVIGNIAVSVGFFELGIYPKIHVTVNVLLAAAAIVITVKKFKFKNKNDKEYDMKISALFKSIVDSDIAPIVICETDHQIVYMNPAAVERYAKRGGASLIGKSLLDCHNDESNKKIKSIVEWFGESDENNRVFTFHNPKENKDVYMIALRDERGVLIGYYEKHEYRTPESDMA